MRWLMSDWGRDPPTGPRAGLLCTSLLTEGRPGNQPCGIWPSAALEPWDSYSGRVPNTSLRVGGRGLGEE